MIIYWHNNSSKHSGGGGSLPSPFLMAAKNTYTGTDSCSNSSKANSSEPEREKWWFFFLVAKVVWQQHYCCYHTTFFLSCIYKVISSMHCIHSFERFEIWHWPFSRDALMYWKVNTIGLRGSRKDHHNVDPKLIYLKKCEISIHIFPPSSFLYRDPNFFVL